MKPNPEDLLKNAARTDFDDPHWISRRVNCTAISVFEKLKECVKRDTEKAIENGLEFQYRTFVTPGEFHVVRGTTEDNASHIMFRISDNSTIDIQFVESRVVVHAKTMTLNVRWNPDDDKCDTLLDGDDLNIVEISERVLRPYFFGD